MFMFVVYLLESSKDKSWYIGYTMNIIKRIKSHNKGENKSTKNKLLWKVIYYEMYLNKMDALGREKFLKSGAGRRFLKKQLYNYLLEG